MIGLRKPFTDREQQIAEAVCAGLSYDEIAEEYQLAARTVRAHVRAIGEKIVEFSELEPRLRVFTYMRQQQWEERRTAGSV